MPDLDCMLEKQIIVKAAAECSSEYIGVLIFDIYSWILLTILTNKIVCVTCAINDIPLFSPSQLVILPQSELHTLSVLG